MIQYNREVAGSSPAWGVFPACQTSKENAFLINLIKPHTIPNNTMGYIYKITNTVTNKVYIGQTINDPDKRWIGHQQSIGTNRGCPALKASMEKHGIDKFKFEVLIICFDSDLSKFEKEYIKKYESFGPKGYNLTHGGEEGGFFTGCKHSPEEVERIKKHWEVWRSNQENLKRHSDKIRQNFQNPDYRKRHSEIMKKVASKVNYTKSPKSEETKQKIRESVLKYYSENQVSPKNRKKQSDAMTKAIGRKVDQFTLDGKYVASFNSIKQAGEINNLNHKSIGHNVRGNTKYSQGFIWKYNST